MYMDFNGKQSWHGGSGHWGGHGERGFDRNGKAGGHGGHGKAGGFHRYGENGGSGGHGEEDGFDRRGEAGGHDGRGEGGGFGGRGGRGGGGFSIGSLLEGKPNAQLLFVGAVSCTRHRGFQMGELMREGRMAILSPTATDFATGRYLHQIVEAIVELSEERNSKEFVLMYGCQLAVLSTDFDLIAKELKENYDITLSVHDHCHMCRTEDEGWHSFGEKGGVQQ